MAQLPPDGEWLVQMISDDLVVLTHRWSEEVLCRFDPGDPNDMFPALARMFNGDGPLTVEQKTLVFFWAGYFYAHAPGKGLR